MSTAPNRVLAGVPSGGQFAARTALEPGIVLGGPPGHEKAQFVTDRHLFERELEALTGGAEIVETTPASKAEMRRALKNLRGEPDGKIRMVRVTPDNYPDTEPGQRIEIHGPNDGRPIIIDMPTGHPFLKVVSGTAIIRPRSGWGNSVDVGAGAEAILVAPENAKVTTEVDEGGTAVFVCPVPKNRFRPYGKGTVYLSTGTDTDRVPYERPVY